MGLLSTGRKTAATKTRTEELEPGSAHGRTTSSTMCGWPWQALWFCSSRSTRPEGPLQLVRGMNLIATRRPDRMSTARATDAHEPLRKRRSTA